MKARSKLILLTAVTAVMVVSLAGAALAAGPWAGSGASGQEERGRMGGSEARLATATVPLTPAEKEHLLFMREEERLARDVYTFLHERWDVKEFEAIAAAESRHMSRVEMLIDRYGLEDLVAMDVPGVFANKELQALYDSLVAQGSQSVEEAYKVGVAIEEHDIADLKEALASTEKRDLTRVFTNLLRGSQNHLEAFTSLLAQ